MSTPGTALVIRRRAQPVPEAALAFQTELEELLAEPPPRLLRGAHHLAAGLFVSLIALATFTEIDIVVTAPGRIVPDAPPIVLAPIERAVIRELRVRPGDAVRRGQVLAVLDPTFAAADAAQLGSQRHALATALRRIEAELAGTAPPMPTPGDRDAALQAVLLAQRQALHATRLHGFAEELRGFEAAIRTLTDAAVLQAEQAAIARDIETLRQRLVEGQIGSRLNLLGARSARLAAERESRDSTNRVEELRHAAASKSSERQGFLDDWRRLLLEDLLRTRAELARTEEALAKASRLSELTVMTAPADGIVLEVARRSVGSVLREAEPLVSLVPDAAPLIVEAAIRSADLGRLHAGDAVTVKVDAYPFQRHGSLQGTLRAVGHESFAAGDPTGPERPTPAIGARALHAARIALSNTDLGGERLIPGMTVTAEIAVGTRRVIAYFLAPLLRGAQESLREP